MVCIAKTDLAADMKQFCGLPNRTVIRLTLIQFVFLQNIPEKEDHPCQFPIELAERCVLALTNVNDIVYDPFAGVGSALLGALKNNCRAYGTEINAKYVNIGLSRVDRLKNDALKTRPIYQAVYVPKENEKVSQIPDEWKAAQ